MSVAAQVGSSWSTDQYLGNFERDRALLVDSLNLINPQHRFHADKYAVMCLSKDPKFPYQGMFKKIYYCVLPHFESKKFDVFVVAQSVLSDGQLVKEQKVQKLLSQTKVALQPILSVNIGKYNFAVSNLFTEGDLLEFSKSPISKSLKDQIEYELACLLSICHEKGVILKDFKPENVLVRKLADESYELKFIDFGLAYLEGDSISESTQFSGTPIYIPLEDWEEAKKNGRTLPVTAARDIWPLGVCLYSLETDRFPVGEFTRGQAIVGLHLYKDDGRDLGIYGSVIRDILYKDRDSRPPLASIKERMRTILLATYPHLASKVDSPASAVASSLTPIERDSPISIASETSSEASSDSSESVCASPSMEKELEKLNV